MEYSNFDRTTKVLQILIILIFVVATVYVTYDVLQESNREEYHATLDRVIETNLISDNTIEALKDQTNIHGEITGSGNLLSFTAKGRLENIDVYRVFVSRGEWSESITIPANLTKVIKCEEGVEPHLETWNSNVPGRTKGNEDYVTTYKLYIPKESIITDISIDLAG